MTEEMVNTWGANRYKSHAGKIHTFTALYKKNLSASALIS